jgi:hypothetical protein
MKLYQVIFHHYSDYEMDDEAVLMTSDSLELAKEHALKMIRENLAKKFNYENTFFSSYSYFDSFVKIFRNSNRYSRNYFQSYYVREVELNQPVTKRNAPVAWSITEEDIFNFFKKDIATIFEKEMVDMISDGDVESLFKKFKENRKLFRKGYIDRVGYPNVDAATLISLTASNEDEIAMFEQYEAS